MASLNSHCPPLGSEVDIYLHSNADVSMNVSNFTCRSKIVGVYTFAIGHAEWLLAWKINKSAPSNKYAKNTYKNVIPSQLQHSSFTNDVDQYNWYCWLSGNAEITNIVQPPASKITYEINWETDFPILKSDIIGEASCKNPTCGKMNDLTSKTCWWCCGTLQ